MPIKWGFRDLAELAAGALRFERSSVQIWTGLKAWRRAFAGCSSMIPYAGPLVAGTGISLIALFTQGIWHGLASAIYFIVYGVLEGNVLSPLVFRRTVHVNPLVVTLSILFLGEIAGIMGAIIAVPVVATLQIVLRELLRMRRERLSLAGEEA